MFSWKGLPVQIKDEEKKKKWRRLEDEHEQNVEGPYFTCQVSKCVSKPTAKEVERREMMHEAGSLMNKA